MLSDILLNLLQNIPQIPFCFFSPTISLQSVDRIRESLHKTYIPKFLELKWKHKDRQNACLQSDMLQIAGKEL